MNVLMLLSDVADSAGNGNNSLVLIIVIVVAVIILFGFPISVFNALIKLRPRGFC